jgi:hypothetical protein
MLDRASGNSSRIKSPKPDVAKAEAYFERSFAVAGAQQAKSWERIFMFVNEAHF